MTARRVTTAEAILAAQKSALSNPSVVLLGESVGRLGGCRGTSAGLLAEFGEERVIDLPVGSAGAAGLAAGLAMGGKRPILEVSGADRLDAMMEQLASEIGGLAARSGGAFSAPVVVRVPDCGAAEMSALGSLADVDGLTVVTPSSAEEASGMILGALASSGPVVVVEPGELQGNRGGLNLEATSLAGSNTLRAGELTIFTWGAGVALAMEVAEAEAANGVEVGVVDLRSLNPIDLAGLAGALRESGFGVILHNSEAYARNLASTLTEATFLYLEAPIGLASTSGGAAGLKQIITSTLNY